jgi:Tfp pilus assembly protein PilV
MMRRRRSGGFTLLEAMVALLLLSLTALALSECLLASQRMQQESGRWMRAVALAEQAVEQARAGAANGDDVVGLFARRWSSSLAGVGLWRVEVVVAWQGREYRLTTLVRS